MNFTTPTTPESSPGSDAPPLVSDESEVNGSTIVVGGDKKEDFLPTIYEMEEIHEAGRVLIDSYVKICFAPYSILLLYNLLEPKRWEDGAIEAVFQMDKKYFPAGMLNWAEI